MQRRWIPYIPKALPVQSKRLVLLLYMQDFPSAVSSTQKSEFKITAATGALSSFKHSGSDFSAMN